MDLFKEIEKLKRENVIDAETAERISKYYESKEDNQPSRLVLLFGVLGAILSGLGLLLIVAHNWDMLSKWTKTSIAFAILASAHLLGIYVLLKKNEYPSWKESASSFLSLALASTISLIAQIYHISGPFDEFLLYLSLMCFPLVYLFSSNATTLLYLFAITLYMLENNFGRLDPSQKVMIYLMLVALVIPHYIRACNKNQTYLLSSLHWAFPFSLLLCPAVLGHHYGDFTFISYFSMLSIFIGIAGLDYFENRKPFTNGYLLLGVSGTILLLWILSFDGFWSTLKHDLAHWSKGLSSPEFLLSLLLNAIALILMIVQYQKKNLSIWWPLQGTFILFNIIFWIGLYGQMAVLLMNALALFLGIVIIRTGIQKKDLTILNVGLILLSGLAICRFFDSDLSYIVRGLLFLCIGIGFFLINYRMLKHKSKDEK